MRRCIFCGGELRYEENTTYSQTIEDGGRVVRVVIDSVPADVCQRCGQKEYSEEVTKRLLALVKTAKADARDELVASRFYTFKSKAPKV